MSYQVLARKWRPRSFSEVVGQAHVIQALTNALTTDRIHHAYLFTGTRGVGKTSLARIIAKSLNCEQGVTANPCNQCANCNAINQGRFVDLLEIDAASRTRVEDTRELLDNVQYTPTQGRYKVYLIDEVHMLSTHSFNALLKTLEEPPAYVKFLLATTEPDRLPITILSRCIRLHLKRLSVDKIAGQLAHCLAGEQIDAEQSALQALAQAADGSMRDALSLLDQAIVFGQGQVRAADVHAMLGTVQQTHIIDLLAALARKDGQLLLQKVAEMAELAIDFKQALVSLSHALHQMAWLQVVSSLPACMDSAAFLRLNEEFSAEDIQLLYQITLHGQRDFALVPDARQSFEMTLLRMLAFFPGSLRPDLQSQVNQARETRRLEAEPPTRIANAPSPAIAEPVSVPTAEKKTEAQPQPPAAVEDVVSKPALEPVAEPPEQVVPEPAPKAEPVTTTAAEMVESAPVEDEGQVVDNGAKIDSWETALPQLDIEGITRMLANHCILESQSPSSIELALDSAHRAFAGTEQSELLERALSKHLGRSIKLRLKIGTMTAETPAKKQAEAAQQRRDESIQAMVADERLQAIADAFDANIDEKGIKLIENEESH